MRSIEEIVSEILDKAGVSLVEFRGHRQSLRLREVRAAAMLKVWAERPDLSSGEIARYFNREGSTVRHVLSKAGVMA